MTERGPEPPPRSITGRGGEKEHADDGTFPPNTLPLLTSLFLSLFAHGRESSSAIYGRSSRFSRSATPGHSLATIEYTTESRTAPSAATRSARKQPSSFAP